MIHVHSFYKNVLYWYLWKELRMKGIWSPLAHFFCTKPSANILESNLRVWKSAFWGLAHDSEPETDVEPLKWEAGSSGDPIGVTQFLCSDSWSSCHSLKKKSVLVFVCLFSHVVCL